MVLSTVFEQRQPSVSDNGYMYTADDGNMAQNSEISTGSGTLQGNIGAMFDNDATTYFATGANAGAPASGWTYYITFDMGRRISKANIAVYYTSYGAGVQGHTSTLQISDDDSTYTDIDSVSIPGGGEAAKNYAGQQSFRYFRVKSVKPTPGADDAAYARIYNLRISKA